MAGKKKKESIGEYVDIDSLVEWEHNPSDKHRSSFKGCKVH